LNIRKWPGNEDVEELKSEEDWDDEKLKQSDSNSEEHMDPSYSKFETERKKKLLVLFYGR